MDSFQVLNILSSEILKGSPARRENVNYFARLELTQKTFMNNASDRLLSRSTSYFTKKVSTKTTVKTRIVF